MSDYRGHVWSPWTIGPPSPGDRAENKGKGLEGWRARGWLISSVFAICIFFPFGVSQNATILFSNDAQAIGVCSFSNETTDDFQPIRCPASAWVLSLVLL